MAIRADHFRVKSIRPSAHLRTEDVPQELQERLLGRVVALRDLEELGASVKTSRLYHGGESLVVVYWHGEEYVLDLDPVTE